MYSPDALLSGFLSPCTLTLGSWPPCFLPVFLVCWPGSRLSGACPSLFLTLEDWGGTHATHPVALLGGGGTSLCKPAELSRTLTTPESNAPALANELHLFASPACFHGTLKMLCDDELKAHTLGALGRTCSEQMQLRNLQISCIPTVVTGCAGLGWSFVQVAECSKSCCFCCPLSQLHVKLCGTRNSDTVTLSLERQVQAGTRKLAHFAP